MVRPVNYSSDLSPKTNLPGPHAAGAAQPSSPASLVGVVLAGGAGSRLGGNKADLRLPGRRPEEPGPRLVEWAVMRLAAVAAVDEVLVAAGNTDSRVDSGGCGRDARVPRGRRVPVSVIGDGPGSGPAAGVLGAARAQPERALLVLACDLPLVPVELLAALADSRADLASAASDPADPWTMNPTCALWTPPALRLLERRVATGDFRLYPTLQRSGLRVQAIDAARFGDPDRVLLNVNTADDWDRAQRLAVLADLPPAAR